MNPYLNQGTHTSMLHVNAELQPIRAIINNAISKLAGVSATVTHVELILN